MTISMLSMALALMALVLALLNAARLWQQARRRVLEQIGRDFEALESWGRKADTALERLAGPRPLEPFTACPGCGHHAYHLLSAPREHLTGRRVDRLALDGPPPRAGFYEVQSWSSLHVTRYRVRPELEWVTVIDRECLSCGKTWMETDSDPGAPQARSIPDGREEP